MAKKKNPATEKAKLTDEAAGIEISIDQELETAETIEVLPGQATAIEIEEKPKEEPKAELVSGLAVEEEIFSKSEGNPVETSPGDSDTPEVEIKDEQSSAGEQAYLDSPETNQDPLSDDAELARSTEKSNRVNKSKKGSFKAKLEGKLSLTKKPKTVDTSLEPEFSAEQASYTDPIEAIEELAQLQKQLPLNLAEINRNKAKSEEVQEQRLEQEKQLSNVDSWISRQEGSYFWNVKQGMDQNLTNAKSDLEDYEAEAKSLDIPDEGELVRIRESFHKNLGRSFLAFLFPTLLLLLIPWATRQDLAGKIVNGVNSGWLIPAFVISLAVYLGILGLIQRGRRQQKKNTPWKTLLTQWAVILGVAIFIILNFWAHENDTLLQVTRFIESIRVLMITTLAIALFFAIVGLLIGYYSKWSEFRRKVVEQYNRLENVVNGYIKTKQEIARLENLYQQLNEWLEVLAHSVYRPWKVNPAWKTKTTVETVSETMPRALRVAEAIESENAETAKLEKLISDHLLVQGWRNHAFEDSLRQIATGQGLSAAALAPAQLDRDLPHQPNNTRKLTLEAFRSAANNLEDPQTPSYLERVARSKMGELVVRAQKYALSEAQPKVELIVKDPLRTLVSNGVEENSMTITSEWDGFLSKNLGLQEVVQPPLSTLGFTDDGIMRELHKPTSFVLAPEKLIKKLEKLTAESVKLTPVEVDVENPRAEIVVRIDVTQAISYENIKLLSSGAHKAFSSKSEPLIDESNQDL